MNELLPPTVPVPLGVLLDHPELGLRQLAGAVRGGARGSDGSGGVPVHSVHTSEMEDPVPYLLGGELLLSAGVHCPPGTQDSAAHWERYVARTVEAGAAALGFGIAPVHESVPRALVDACDRHGLPLLEVPRRTPFTAVARAVWQAMAERRHRELRRTTEAQRSLAGAAARPHPVAAVLRQLARHLEAWTVLLGPDGTELAAAGTRPPEGARTALASLAARLRQGPSSAADTWTDEAREFCLSAYGLPGRGRAGDRLALGVCARRRDTADGTIAGVAVVLLSLLTAPRTVTADAGRTAALVRLMLGAAPADVTPLLTAPLTAAGPGAEETGPPGGHTPGPGALWTVVHGRRRGTAGAGSADGMLAGAALAAGLGTGLVDLDADGTGFRALVPGAAPVAALPGWTLGTGTPVPPGELERGDAEAARALRRALAERAPVVRHRGDAGVTSLVGPAEARAHAHAWLDPLAGSPALVETLRVWLSLHGSWDRTAVALEVHRNTVRQRVARAAELLGADLGEADVRMDLWFALKWFRP